MAFDNIKSLLDSRQAADPQMLQFPSPNYAPSIGGMLKTTPEKLLAWQLRNGIKGLGEPQIATPVSEVSTPFAAGWQPMKRAYGGKGIA